MGFFHWVFAFIIGIVLATAYKGAKWPILVIGFVLTLLSFSELGGILMLGVVFAYAYIWVNAGFNICTSIFSSCAQNLKKIGVIPDQDLCDQVDEIIKLIDDTNFSDPEEVLEIIQKLSCLDRDFLSLEQINLLRAKTAQLWKIYYKLLTQDSKKYTKQNDIKSPYDILGVDCNATKAEIRSAYIKLCKQYHPDVNHSKFAEAKFKEIQEAYNILYS